MTSTLSQRFSSSSDRISSFNSQIFLSSLKNTYLIFTRYERQLELPWCGICRSTSHSSTRTAYCRTSCQKTSTSFHCSPSFKIFCRSSNTKISIATKTNFRLVWTKGKRQGKTAKFLNFVSERAPALKEFCQFSRRMISEHLSTALPPSE